MKKLLFALSAAAAFAPDALCGTINVSANTSPDTAASVDGNTQVVLNTSRTAAEITST